MASIEKGQAFIMGAILFALAFVMVFITLSSIQTQTEGSNIKHFFSSTAHTYSNVLDKSLKENRSIDEARRQYMSYDGFISRESAEKSISFGAFHFITYPSRGEYTVINYRASQIEANISVNGNTQSYTLASKGWADGSFTPGTSKFVVETDRSRFNFSAAKPRVYTNLNMSNKKETWVRTIVN